MLNPDLPVAHRDLLGLDVRRLERLDYSPSCWLMLAGSSASYSKIAHHNIHFGRALEAVCLGATILDVGHGFSVSVERESPVFDDRPQLAGVVEGPEFTQL